MRKLDAMPEKDCLMLIQNIRKNYRIPAGPKTMGELLVEARQKSGAEKLKEHDIMEMIAKVKERKGRLDLPIVSGKHLRRVSDRAALQSADNAEKFITTRKIDSF